MTCAALTTPDQEMTDWDRYELKGKVKSINWVVNSAGGNEGMEVRLGVEDPSTFITFSPEGFVETEQEIWREAENNKTTYYTHKASKLVLKIKKDHNDSTLMRSTYTYAKDGFVETATVVFSKLGAVRHERWSEKDSITTLEWWLENYPPDSNHYIQTKVEHASTGIHEISVRRLQDTKPLQTMIRIVDRDDRMLSYVEFDSNKVLLKKQTFAYDGKGNVLLEKKYEGDKLIKCDSSFYDAKNLCVERFTTYPVGDEYTTYHFKYRYQFDAQGNWISKIEYEIYGDSTTVRIVNDPNFWTERKITYY